MTALLLERMRLEDVNGRRFSVVVHTCPVLGLCKTASPFWPHKNQKVRWVLLLVMSEVPPPPSASLPDFNSGIFLF